MLHCVVLLPCAALCCAVWQGVPTVEGVRQALQQMGPLPVTQLSLLNVHLDAVRVGDEGKKLLKARILQVRSMSSCI